MAKPKIQLSLKQLQKTWYAKLQKNGFKDIETGEYGIKRRATEDMFQHTFDTVDDVKNGQFNRNERIKTARIVHNAKETYYYEAEHFLNNYKFKDNREKIIWEYHANGMTIRDIVKTFGKLKIKLTNYRVWKTIKQLAQQMKKQIK